MSHSTFTRLSSSGVMRCNSVQLMRVASARRRGQRFEPAQDFGRVVERVLVGEAGFQRGPIRFRAALDRHRILFITGCGLGQGKDLFLMFKH